MEHRWAKETTDYADWGHIGGRGLEIYEQRLNFSREDLRGKTILDIGSGSTERFAREVQSLAINARVFSLNPDYVQQKYRSKIIALSDWQRHSVAGLGQALPFLDNTFDAVMSLYALEKWNDPHNYPDDSLRWASEVVRILKPGGTARFAPIATFTPQGEDEVRQEYREIISVLQEKNITPRFEPVEGLEKPKPHFRMIIQK